jgi:hypothetical protein
LTDAGYHPPVAVTLRRLISAEIRRFLHGAVFTQLHASDVNRASATSSAGALQALFLVVAVFAPENPVPLRVRQGHLPEQSEKIAVFAATVRNTHPDTSNGENDNDSRT